MTEEKGMATFICTRHSNVPGCEGPFKAPIRRLTNVEGPLGEWHINCPICGRVYVLRDGLEFYCDRPLKLLRIDFA